MTSLCRPITYVSTLLTLLTCTLSAYAASAQATEYEVIPVPESTAWVSWLVLIIVYLFIAAIILGPIVARLAPAPAAQPDTHHANPHTGH